MKTCERGQADRASRVQSCTSANSVPKKEKTIRGVQQVQNQDDNSKLIHGSNQQKRLQPEEVSWEKNGVQPAER